MINEQLLELYKPHGKDFVPCGLTEETTYLLSKPKLVFVLKEANVKGKQGKSLVESAGGWVSSAENGKAIRFLFWRRIGIWSYAIHHGFPDYENIDTPHTIAEGLKSIGITNLKKSGGYGSSNDKRIRHYAESTLDSWKRELEIMNPDIILCGGTYDIVTDLLKLESHPMASGRNYSIWEEGNNRKLILEFYHPSLPFCSNQRLYALLKDSFNEAKDLLILD